MHRSAQFWSPEEPGSSVRTSFWTGSARNRASVINLDKLTYAGNLGNLASLEDEAAPYLRSWRYLRSGARALAPAAAQAPRGRAFCRREPRRPLDQRSGRIRPHQREWHAQSAAAEPHILGWPRRGSRSRSFRFLHVSTDEVYGTLGRRRSGIYRRDAVCAEQPLRGLKGGFRPPGSRLAPYLRISDPDHQLLQQLRAVPVPGEADSAGDC